jgi:hypothetical protein
LVYLIFISPAGGNSLLRGVFLCGFYFLREEKFMDSQQLFCLSGFGYLEKISFEESKCIAQIKVIPQCSQDEVYLDCEIQGIFEDYLYHLYESVKKGKSVIVSFKAAYRQFKTLFYFANPEGTHEDHIVRLSGKMIELGKCYINGSLVDNNYCRFMKAA